MFFEYIEIYGLHGYKNCRISFNEKYQIFLSENGWGKTTVLKILNSIINNDFPSLKKIKFSYILFKIEGSSEKRISKDMLEISLESSRALNFLKRKFGDGVYLKINEVLPHLEKGPEGRSILKKIFFDSGWDLNSISPVLVRDLFEEKEDILKGTYFLNSGNDIKKFVTIKSLYLPTYRRIEEDFIVNDVDSPLFKGLINFGVGDVKNKLEEIRNNIIAEANRSMSEINGEILTRLVNGLDISGDDYWEILKESINDLPKILNRVGKSLSEGDKNRIISLTESGEIFDSGNKVLAYFLSKICKNHKEQKINEKSLSVFSDVCSKYFVNKEIVFDENDLSVKIFDEFSGGEIEFNDLSSGEKQIVSIFSKLYLNNSEKYIVLFDEPELSLSVEWQEKILHDVVAASSCKYLVAMTHSPFVYSGLESNTREIKEIFF